LLPEIKPGHLAIGPLLSQELPQDEQKAAEIVQALAEAPVYEGPERRSGVERRGLIEARPHERRVFGRRSTDQVHWGSK
jgi:hypothetical protein